MNFDQFYKFLLKYKNQLNSLQLKNATNLLKNLIKITKINRQKLKLGKILFFINSFDINKPFQELLTIKFVNQDLSDSIEDRIQKFDENLKWKWTKTHVGSFLLVFSLFLYYTWQSLKLWLQINLPFLYFHSVTFENLLYYTLQQTLNPFFYLTSTDKELFSFIIDVVFQLCLYLNILI